MSTRGPAPLPMGAGPHDCVGTAKPASSAPPSNSVAGSSSDITHTCAALPATAIPWAASGTGTGPVPVSPEDDRAYGCSTWDGSQRFVDTPVAAPPAPCAPPRSAQG